MEIVATLLIVGVILILLETVLPGMIAGVVGLLCLIWGVVMAFTDFGPVVGSRVLLGVLSLLLILSFLWIKFFPDSRLGQMFVTRRAIGTLGVEKPELVNQTGTALTVLRPAGAALVNGKRIDVVTEGGLIEKGTPIRVVAVEGLRVIVRPL